MKDLQQKKSMCDKKKDKLVAEFPPVSSQEWEDIITRDLKGADYTKKLIWNSPEGFRIKPYYRAEDLQGLEYLKVQPGRFPYVRGTKTNANDWIIRQDIDTPDIESANALALQAIRRGAQAIGFNAQQVLSYKEMNRLLSGIDITDTQIHFIKSVSYPLTVELFLYEIRNRDLTGEKIYGSINFDYLGYLLLHGDFYQSKVSNQDELDYLLQTIQKHLPYFRAITINGQLFQDTGSGMVQELAFSLASGHEYLVGMMSKGFDPLSVTSSMIFSFAIGPDYFFELAKLRAARLLWAKIVAEYLPESQNNGKMYIHSETARWNKTIYDPYVNLLRTTTEGMSAILGNTDSLTIRPFNEPYRQPDEFSLRLALNQQLIMKEESYLDKIVDPSAGSYYLETLTDSFAQRAWSLFQEIEADGGIIETIKSGQIQLAIEETRKKKEQDIAQRKEIVLGTNEFPNLNEQMLGKLTRKSGSSDETSSYYPRLNYFRIAGEFEKMRLATETFVVNGNKTPSLFLLNIGDLGMARARAGFITNFFGCAGYVILDNPRFNTIEEGVQAAIQSGTNMVAICSSDDEYPLYVPEICTRLKSENPEIWMIVAGYPKEQIDSLKKSGVDDFIHVRSNILQTLMNYQQRLGIL